MAWGRGRGLASPWLPSLLPIPLPPPPVWFSPFTASRLGRLLPEPQSLPGSRPCRRDTRIDGVTAATPDVGSRGCGRGSASGCGHLGPPAAFPPCTPARARGLGSGSLTHHSRRRAMSNRKASPRNSQCFLPAVAQSQGDNPVASSRAESRGRGVRVPHPSCPGPVLQVCEE